MLSTVEGCRKITQNSWLLIKGSGGLMDKVSASQPPDRGFELHKGHDHDTS